MDTWGLFSKYYHSMNCILRAHTLEIFSNRFQTLLRISRKFLTLRLACFPSQKILMCLYHSHGLNLENTGVEVKIFFMLHLCCALCCIFSFPKRSAPPKNFSYFSYFLQSPQIPHFSFQIFHKFPKFPIFRVFHFTNSPKLLSFNIKCNISAT